MPEREYKNRIESILADSGKPKQERIRALRTLREDLRSAMRTATESAMTEDRDFGADLQRCDQALRSLGADPAGDDEKGAATL